MLFAVYINTKTQLLNTIYINLKVDTISYCIKITVQIITTFLGRKCILING